MVTSPTPAAVADRSKGRAAVVRSLVWATVFVLAALGGRATIIDGTAMSLVWPAAGVAAVWLRGSRGSWFVADLLLLAGCTAVVNRVTGAPWALVLAFILANIVQVTLFVVLCRGSRSAPGDGVPGCIDGFEHVAGLWRTAQHAFVATAVGAGIGCLVARWVIGDLGPADFVVWWARNLAGMVVVVAAVAIVGRDDTGPVSIARTIVVSGVDLLRQRGVEVIALVCFTGGIYWASFVRYPDLPVVFIIMLATLWAGTRFGVTFALAHALSVSAIVVTLTLHGVGPVASLPSIQAIGIIVQLIIVTSSILGLALSLGREERASTLVELSAAKARSDLEAQRFHLLADAVDEGVALVDPKGQVISCNKALVAMKGHDGRPPTRLPSGDYRFSTLAGEEVQEDRLPIAVAAAEGRAIELDLFVTPLTGGEQRVVRVSATPLRGDAGQVERVLVVYRDRTAEHLRVQQLESFAGSVAHDLRSPLTALRGWVELSAMISESRHGRDPELVETLSRADRAAERMGFLITDLLDFSREGRASQDERVDMEELVTSVVDMRLATADPKTHVILGPLPPAMGQAGLIRQVVDNIVGNAISHAGDGRAATIVISGIQSDGWVRYRIADDGPGIPVEEREHVFRPFHRLRQDSGGQGLGLSIARRIVTSHGGRIEITESHPSGACFSFTLPAPERPRPEDLSALADDPEALAWPRIFEG